MGIIILVVTVVLDRLLRFIPPAPDLISLGLREPHVLERLPGYKVDGDHGECVVYYIGGSVEGDGEGDMAIFLVAELVQSPFVNPPRLGNGATTHQAFSQEVGGVQGGDDSIL